MTTYDIWHEAPAAPGISQLCVATVEAESEEDALLKHFPTASKVSRRDNGQPCINFGFGATILRQYVAIAR